jgi:Putative MetA-pathway of phenol degradation
MLWTTAELGNPFQVLHLGKSPKFGATTQDMRPPASVALVAVILLSAWTARAQELDPAAYSISPVGVNILVVANTLNIGDVDFDPAVPIEQAKATINSCALGYVRTLNVAGRSSSFGIVAPYVVGHLEGLYLGQFQTLDRSGLGDPRFRFAINLYGGPAMKLKQFASYRPKTNVGISLTVGTPLGQYDPAKVINLGANRWSFKPELGVTHTLGRWTLEGYGGAWLFTRNTNFFNEKTRTQDPLGSFQFHLNYAFRPRLWAAFDANFYTGGRTSINGVRNFDLQQNSRMGGTLAIPFNRRQSFKLSYSHGAYTTIGGNFNSIAIFYQYIWGGGL